MKNTEATSNIGVNEEPIYKDELIFSENAEIEDRIYRSIKKAIREEMYKKSITCSELAERIKGSNSYLYKVLYRDSKPGLIVLMKICLALDLSLCDLLPPMLNEDGSVCNMQGSFYMTTADELYHALVEFMEEHNIRPIEQDDE